MSNLFSDIFLQRPWRLGFVGVFVVLSAAFALWLSGSALSALGAVADFVLPVAFFAALMALFHARSLAASRARVLAGAFAFAFWYAAFHVFLVACAAFFVWYHNNISPAVLPKVTISNGDKTIVFRTMSHVASDSFYRGVIADIEAAKRDGYWYWYEGVRPGTDASGEEFSRMLGIDFDRDLYSELGRSAGLSAQTEYDFTGLVNDRDVNSDLDMDEIVSRIRERMGTWASAAATAIPPVDLSEFADRLDSLAPNERGLFALLNRAILNFVMKLDSPAAMAAADPRLADVFAVILDARDAHVADELLASPEKKFFLTYGLMHFDGIYARLKASDPAYAIIKVEAYHPFVSE